MAATAKMFPILPGMTPAVLEFAEEVLGPRRAEHDESHRVLGLTAEKMWVEPTNEGDVLIIYLEGDDLDKSMRMLGESSHNYDLWFKEKFYTLTGADLCDIRVAGPAKLEFESPLVEGRVPGAATATAFHVSEGRLDDFQRFLKDELGGAHADAYRDYLTRFGITRERFYLDLTPKGERVVLYIEGDDPAGAVTRFARSSHPFDAWLREEMLYLNGIDYIRRQTAPPPHLILDWKAPAREKAA